ncbi:MAG: Wzz/FepE/Etk N-terminal domain-containing protein [Candidatus Krumholzibacteriia bacterium]
MTNGVRGPVPGGEASLASLLGILWRRRAIVVGLTAAGLAAGIAYILVVAPLYRATASVRPGITAFTERGDPVREWKLKDITYWFGRRMYGDALRAAFGWSRGQPAPVIDAEFIPRGSQNIQGGDVITLQVLDTDPQRAVRILDGAIDAFNVFAVADTTVSGMALTRAGLEVQIANLRNDQDKLLTKKERLALTITDAEQELAGVAANRQRVELELTNIAAANRFRRSLLAVAEEQAGAAVRSREDLEQTLQRLTAAAGRPTLPADSLAATLAQRGLAPWLIESLRRGDAADVGSAAVSELALRRFEQRNRALADSLRYEIDLAQGAVTDLKLKRDVDLEKNRVAAVGRIDDLKLQQDREVATERMTLEQAIRGKRAQLSVLSPLERIGRTQVTIRPVRPRRLRAVILLTLAGGLASLAAALGWDYLAAHRDEILRGDRGA